MFDQMPVLNMVLESQGNTLDFLAEKSSGQLHGKKMLLPDAIYLERATQLHLSNRQLEVILAGCRLNQRIAQKNLYRNYYGYAISLAMPYSSGYDNAVEIVNQAFLKIFRGLKNLEPQYDNTLTSFTRSLKRIVVNTGIGYIGRCNQIEVMENAQSPKTVVENELDIVML